MSEDDKFNLGAHNFSADEIAEMMSPALAQERARAKKHQEFIISALQGDLEDNSESEKLRFIVERNSWFVPLKSDGEFEILNVRKGENPALIARTNKKDGRRTDREGLGGQFLPIYQEKQDKHCRELDGRALARLLPSTITGLLVQYDADEQLRELYAQYFEALHDVADAVELEDALMADDPLLTEKILNYKFRVAMYDKGMWRKENVVSIATCVDTQRFDDECSVELMAGKDVFERVLQDGSYSGIVVNRGSDLGRGDRQKVKGLLLSMNFIDRALKSNSCNLSVPSYVVRSREEFELWLKSVLFPMEGCQIIEDKDDQGRIFLHAVSQQKSDWTFREYEWKDTTDSVTTPKFEVRALPGSADEIGAGQSPVLCPALIAKRLYVLLPENGRRDNSWRPGLSFGFGKLLSDDDIAKSKLRVRLANELLKFFPAGEDQLPSSCMRSVEGARFVDIALRSVARTRKWAEDAREQGERNSRKFVFG